MADSKYPTSERLKELRSIVLDGYELGPLDREELNEVLVKALADAKEATPPNDSPTP